MWDLRGEILDVGPPLPAAVDRLRAGPGRRRLGLALLACLLFTLGAVVGAVAGPGRTAQAAAPPAPDLRISLGAAAGGVDGVRDGHVVLVVGAVATNDGRVPLRVTGLRVAGSGVGITDRVAGPLRNLPVLVGPGETRNMPFALIFECSPTARPVPSVRVTVKDDHGRSWSLTARIPDLDALWALAQAPGVCPGTAPGATR